MYEVPFDLYNLVNNLCMYCLLVEVFNKVMDNNNNNNNNNYTTKY